MKLIEFQMGVEKTRFDAVRKDAWERRELHENQEGGGPEGGERGGGEQEVVRRTGGGEESGVKRDTPCLCS